MNPAGTPQVRIRTFENARGGYYAVIYRGHYRLAEVVAEDSHAGFPTREAAKAAARLQAQTR